jgi:hypothetical protein
MLHHVLVLLDHNNTKDKKVQIGDNYYGVTAVKDKIYLGGYNKVIILDINGSRVREVQTDGGTNTDFLLLVITKSFVKTLLNAIPHGSSIPSRSLSTISRNVPSGDNLCMSPDCTMNCYLFIYSHGNN